MSEIIGKQIELGVSMEGTRGTAESTADKWVKKVSADVIAKVEKVIDDSTNGSLEDSQNSRAVKKWFEGELAGVLHADALGYFLKNLYGTSTPTTITGAVTSHLFAMLQNIIHPTLSIFAKDGGNSQEVFNGGVANTLQIEATTDDLVRFNASLMAKSATANSDTPSYDTEYDFIGKDITVKVASSEAGLSGATALELKNLSITWDAGAISDHAFGSYSPADIYNSKMSIEGSFVKNYTDDTFKDLYTADTAVYMQISIVGDTVLAGSNSPKLVILLNKVQIQEWVRSDSRDELVTEEVSFKAFYNAGDAEQSTVTLQNLTSDY